MRWDGTQIDPPELNLKTGQHWNHEIIYSYQSGWISLRDIKNLHPCLIDEFKPIFGLPKNGTHWFLQGKKKILVTRIPLDSVGNPIPPSDDGDKQLALVFREICGIKPTFQTTVKTFDGEPRTFRDQNLVPQEEKSILGSRLYHTHFRTVDDFRKHLLQIIGSNDQIMGLSQLSNRMEEVIKRVDRNEIWLTYHIFHRLRTRL